MEGEGELSILNIIVYVFQLDYNERILIINYRGMSEFVIPSEANLGATVIRQLSRASSNVPFTINWNVQNPLWECP